MRILSVIISSIILCSCIHLSKPKSICDTQTDSLICSIANKHNVRLETAANMIMFANFASIESGSYTSSQAIDFMQQLKQLINVRPNASVIVTFIKKSFRDMPLTAMAGYMMISPYIDYIDVDTPLKDDDVAMLIPWIDSQIDILSN